MSSDVVTLVILVMVLTTGIAMMDQVSEDISEASAELEADQPPADGDVGMTDEEKKVAENTMLSMLGTMVALLFGRGLHRVTRRALANRLEMVP